MSKSRTINELVNFILEEDMINIQEDEEIIHMLLDKTVSKNINHSQSKILSLGERISDKVAEVAGSWAFIISFCLILSFWIILNARLLLKPYDPYPFILLNLILSCIAALQAPVIMMSQNRQEQKDRIRAENDYKVNLKSEVIIEDLHNKLDKLIENQEQIILRLDIIENTKSKK
jgi:uncharacterized membrane protein